MDQSAEIAELKMKLAKALEALELAEGIMSYSRGDAYERECTEKDYDAFRVIYDEFNPPPPPAAPTWSRHGPGRTSHGSELKVPCPHCGKKVGGIVGIKAHIKAKHEPPKWFKS